MSKEPSDARSRFAQRLRAIRIPRGFKTARSFAQALGIDENRYTRYERAEVEPDLQLLMRICELLKATPNDLLCDTIGMPPALDMPSYGFGETAGSNYRANASRENDDASEDRKAVAWQLAVTIATLKARKDNRDMEGLPPIERLRVIGPLFAKLDADPFTFLANLPQELNGIDVPDDVEQRIGELSEKLLG